MTLFEQWLARQMLANQQVGADYRCSMRLALTVGSVACVVLLQAVNALAVVAIPPEPAKDFPDLGRQPCVAAVIRWPLYNWQQLKAAILAVMNL